MVLVVVGCKRGVTMMVSMTRWFQCVWFLIGFRGGLWC